MEITWCHNDRPWSLYFLGLLAWSLSTFSVNLPSLTCMTVILFSPSISSLSLLFQVCWLIRLCMIRRRSTAWLNNLSLSSFLLEPGYSLYSRSQALPVSHTSIRGTTGGCWEPVPPEAGDRRFQTSLLSSSILSGWSGDNGSIPTDQRSKVYWINFTLIKLNIRNIGWFAYYNRNLIHPLLCSRSSWFSL